MFRQPVGASLGRSRAAVLLCLAVVMLASGGMSARAEQPAPASLGPGIDEALAATGQARVVIALAAPAAVLANNPTTPIDMPTLNAQVAATQQAVLARLTVEEYRSVIVYNSVPALAGIILQPSALDKLASDPNVVRVDLDVAGRGDLSTAVPFLDADERHVLGNRGEGVVVAVLDSGVDKTHPDLSDDISFERCFADTDGSINGIGGCPNGSDRQSGSGSAADDVGHGTAVSGVITANGGTTGKGIASDAKVEAIKVIYDCGSGGGCFSAFSEIVAALDYIINNRPSVDVINMSLGTFATFAGNCDNSTSWTMAGASAVNTLRANGVLTVASAANDGFSNAMSAPACLQNVISVGASNYSDNLTSFTNRSATTDVFAPGLGIVTTNVGGGSGPWSGTSFSSPLVAGCAALLIESGDATTPGALESRLESSPVSVHDSVSGRTYPRLDCGADGGPAPEINEVYISAKNGGTVGGLAFAANDILHYNRLTNSWTMFFDASDVALGGNVTSFTFDSNGDLLLAFGANLTVPGVGAVTAQDVVRFDPTQLGPNTAGSFSMYFDGSDVGLTAAAEKIDALGHFIASGTNRLRVSTTGTAKVPLLGGGTLTAHDEDIMVFVFNGAPGAATAGNWSSTLRLDGTPIVGLSGEDVNGFPNTPAGLDPNLFITILGPFNLGGVTGNGKSLVKLTPSGAPGGYTPSIVQWLAPGASFPSDIDGIEFIRD